MQINIYGNPGDGKSYSAIHYIALFAIAEKITFGSNIEGVKPHLISKYLNFLAAVADFRARPKRESSIFQAELAELQSKFTEFASLNVDKNKVPTLSKTELKILVVMRSAGTATTDYDFTQHIKCVDYATVESKEFWYTAESGIEKKAIMQPGETWVIDESARYFGRGKVPPADSLKCINEHRHYVNKEGRAISLYFVAQQPSQLSQDAKQNCQFTYHARRFMSAGAYKAKVFRLDYYEGAVGLTELKKKQFYDNMEDVLNARIFLLYSSVNGATGFETKARVPTVWDARFFGLPLFKFWLPAFSLIASYSIYKLFVFFFDNPLGHKKVVTPTSSASVVSTASATSASSSATTATVEKKDNSPLESKTYRLVGIYSQSDAVIAVISDSENRIRYTSDFVFLANGRSREIIYKNEIVSLYTGVHNEKNTTITTNR